MPTLWTCSQQRSSMLTRPIHSHFKKDSSSKNVFTFYLLANFTEKFHRKKVHMFPRLTISNLKALVFVPRPAPFYLLDEVDAALDASYRSALANLVAKTARCVGEKNTENVGDGLLFLSLVFFRSWNLKRFFLWAKFGYWNVRRWDKIKAVDFQSLKVHSFFPRSVQKSLDSMYWNPGATFSQLCQTSPSGHHKSFWQLFDQRPWKRPGNHHWRDRVQQSPRCVSAQVVQCQRCPAKLHQITLYI